MGPTSLLLVMALACPREPAGTAAPAVADEPAEDLDSPRLADQLLDDFARRLRDPAAYRAEVESQAGAFPEGDLFPYVFPALAWAAVAMRDPARAAEAREHVATLIALAEPPIVSRLWAPGGDLGALEDYGGYATHLGQLGVALGAWRLAGGDDRFQAEHDAVARVLRAALERADGRPIESWPGLVWTFDTVPALLAVRLHDGAADARPLVERHLAWTRDAGTDPETGLPWSRVEQGTFEPVAGPRGCDLSFRVALLAWLDPAAARALYDAYTPVFWLEPGPLAGFAEHPHGASQLADVDSGPIVQGMGMSATGFGLAAARAVGDEARWERLSGELPVVRRLMPLALREGVLSGIPVDRSYRTGFLFGDAALLWSLTWPPPPAGWET